jgi:hypothetical protein
MQKYIYSAIIIVYMTAIFIIAIFELHHLNNKTNNYLSPNNLYKNLDE